MDELREAPRSEPAPASEPAAVPMTALQADPNGEHDPASPAEDEAAVEAALDEYQDGLLAAEVRAAIESSDAVDARFSPTIDPSSVRFGEPTPTKPVCQWCNADLPSADVDRCPSCKVALKPVEGHREVPGLTTPSSETLAAIQRIEIQRQTASVNLMRPDGTVDPDLITVHELPVSAEVLGPETAESYQPPSAEVREMMRRIKWEAFEADPLAMIDPGPLADRRSQREENTL